MTPDARPPAPTGGLGLADDAEAPLSRALSRYPNRQPGRPRFVSALVYLPAEWDAAAWGAPTRFLDPPTGEVRALAERWRPREETDHRSRRR